ncbi:MAG: hypothetical protein M1831_006832 [Alyxoria varia]|nr:MAG: hypothetical protein M1831_006832 [Alyxoria varia]
MASNGAIVGIAIVVSLVVVVLGVFGVAWHHDRQVFTQWRRRHDPRAGRAISMQRAGRQAARESGSNQEAHNTNVPRRLSTSSSLEGEADRDNTGQAQPQGELRNRNGNGVGHTPYASGSIRPNPTQAGQEEQLTVGGGPGSSGNPTITQTRETLATGNVASRNYSRPPSNNTDVELNRATSPSARHVPEVKNSNTTGDASAGNPSRADPGSAAHETERATIGGRGISRGRVSDTNRESNRGQGTTGIQAPRTSQRPRPAREISRNRDTSSTRATRGGAGGSQAQNSPERPSPNRRVVHFPPEHRYGLVGTQPQTESQLPGFPELTQPRGPTHEALRAFRPDRSTTSSTTHMDPRGPTSQPPHPANVYDPTVRSASTEPEPPHHGSPSRPRRASQSQSPTRHGRSSRQNSPTRHMRAHSTYANHPHGPSPGAQPSYRRRDSTGQGVQAGQHYYVPEGYQPVGHVQQTATRSHTAGQPAGQPTPGAPAQTQQRRRSRNHGPGYPSGAYVETEDTQSTDYR